MLLCNHTITDVVLQEGSSASGNSYRSCASFLLIPDDCSTIEMFVMSVAQVSDCRFDRLKRVIRQYASLSVLISVCTSLIVSLEMACGVETVHCGPTAECNVYG